MIQAKRLIVGADGAVLVWTRGGRGTGPRASQCPGARPTGVHAYAPRRENPRCPAGPGRRAQAGPGGSSPRRVQHAEVLSLLGAPRVSSSTTEAVLERQRSCSNGVPQSLTPQMLELTGAFANGWPGTGFIPGDHSRLVERTTLPWSRDHRRACRSRMRRGRTLASWRRERGLELAPRWHRGLEAQPNGPAPHLVLRLAVLGAVGGRGRDLGRVLAHHLAHTATARYVPARDAAAVPHCRSATRPRGNLVHTPRLLEPG